MQHPRFRSGEISTAFIEEEYPDGFGGLQPDAQLIKRIMAMAFMAHHKEEKRLGSTRASGDSVVRIDRTNHALSWSSFDSGIEIEFDDGTNAKIASEWSPGETLIHARYNDSELTGKINPMVDGYRIRINGSDEQAIVLSPADAALYALLPEKVAPDTSKLLICPMPGLVLSLMVDVGDVVEEGQSLAIVEAMKMENVLRAAKAGTIKKVHCKEGDSLAVDDIILEFDDE